MANLPRQDRNGVRTPQHIERKYKLSTAKKEVLTLKQTSESQKKNLNELNDAMNLQESITEILNGIVEEIINNLDNKVDSTEFNTSVNSINNNLKKKVDKEEGKVLSSNDFTDALKQKLEGITTHSHTNITTLNKITEEIWTKITNAIKNDEYNLSDYKTSAVTSITGKFFIKNDRAVINAELELDNTLTNTSIILLQNLPIDVNTKYKFDFDGGNYNIANKKLTVNFDSLVIPNLILSLVFDF